MEFRYNPLMLEKPGARLAALAVGASVLFVAAGWLLTRERAGRGFSAGGPDRLEAFARDAGLSPDAELCRRDSVEGRLAFRSALYRGAPRSFRVDRFPSFVAVGDQGQAPALQIPGMVLTTPWASSSCGLPKGLEKAAMKRRDLLLRRGQGPETEWLIFSLNVFERGMSFTEVRLGRSTALAAAAR